MKKFLKDKERDQLITQHRQEKDGRTRDRIKAVLMSDTGWTFKDIAEALLLDQETISRHVKEYREQQKLIPNSSQTIDFIRSKLSLILLCMLSAIIGHVSLKKLLIFSLNSLPVLKN